MYLKVKKNTQQRAAFCEEITPFCRVGTPEYGYILEKKSWYVHSTRHSEFFNGFLSTNCEKEKT